MAVQCQSSMARPHFQLHLQLLVNRDDNDNGGDYDASTFQVGSYASAKYLSLGQNPRLQFLRLDLHSLSSNSTFVSCSLPHVSLSRPQSFGALVFLDIHSSYHSFQPLSSLPSSPGIPSPFILDREDSLMELEGWLGQSLNRVTFALPCRFGASSNGAVADLS